MRIEREAMPPNKRLEKTVLEFLEEEQKAEE